MIVYQQFKPRKRLDRREVKYTNLMKNVDLIVFMIVDFISANWDRLLSFSLSLIPLGFSIYFSSKAKGDRQRERKEKIQSKVLEIHEKLFLLQSEINHFSTKKSDILTDQKELTREISILENLYSSIRIKIDALYFYINTPELRMYTVEVLKTLSSLLTNLRKLENSEIFIEIKKVKEEDEYIKNEELLGLFYGDDCYESFNNFLFDMKDVIEIEKIRKVTHFYSDIENIKV